MPTMTVIQTQKRDNNEYEKDCQSGKQPWKGHKIFHDRYRSSIVEAYLSANNQ